MSKITFVVEFEDGKEPPVHANMDVLGGKLTRVAWSDAIQDMEDMEINHRSELASEEFYRDLQG